MIVVSRNMIWVWCVNKNVVAKVGHDEYKDVLLNNKCLRHSMNGIRSKNRWIEAYEINKIYLSCFDDKINIDMMN